MVTVFSKKQGTVMPMSEFPSGKREVFQDNATHKKREVYC